MLRVFSTSKRACSMAIGRPMPARSPIGSRAYSSGGYGRDYRDTSLIPAKAGILNDQYSRSLRLGPRLRGDERMITAEVTPPAWPARAGPQARPQLRR